MERIKQRGRPRKYKTPEEAKAAKRAQDKARDRRITPMCCRMADRTAKGSKRIEYEGWARADIAFACARHAPTGPPILPGGKNADPFEVGIPIKVIATVHGAAVVKASVRRCDQHKDGKLYIGRKKGSSSSIDPVDPTEDPDDFNALFYLIKPGFGNEPKGQRVCRQQSITYLPPEPRMQWIYIGGKKVSKHGYDADLERQQSQWLFEADREYLGDLAEATAARMLAHWSLALDRYRPYPKTGAEVKQEPEPMDLADLERETKIRKLWIKSASERRKTHKQLFRQLTRYNICRGY